MTAFSVAFILILGVAALLAGYWYTIREFKHMSEHPDQFSDLNKKDSIKIDE